MTIYNLRTENLNTPLGIDTQNPSFSWQVKTKEKNWKQSSYQILAALSEDDILNKTNLMWDSGKVDSTYMNNICYSGLPLPSDTVVYWMVCVWQKDGTCQKSPLGKFVTGLFAQNDWHGKWIGEIEDKIYNVYRNGFTIENKKIERASLFVCGLGHYEMQINGSYISNRVLEPGWTNYKKTSLYSSYNITDCLKNGKNAVGIILGDGMFNLPGGRYVYYKRSYGKIKLMVQMNIYYSDGSKSEMVSGAHWKKSKSPLTFCCIYGGEDYDARILDKNYSLPDFIVGNNWENAVIVEAPSARLCSQLTPPIIVKEEYSPIKVEQTSPGTYLYDLGRNFSGWVKIKVKSTNNPHGTVITLTPSEIITNKKKPDQRVTGMGYHWQYTMNEDAQQEYRPHFTYSGFRYVQLEGAVPIEFAKKEETLPVVETLTGQFLYPDVDLAGEFNCSVPLYNSIHEIVTQSMKSNMKSVLTDCPHRERLGWMEQTHLIAPGLLFNFDLKNLYEKIEKDIMESQHENGMIPSICPQYVEFGYHEGFNDSPEWGSAGILIPWYIYKRYGDTGLLRKYYPIMKKYTSYLESKTHHQILHHGLGDWLDIGPTPPYSQNTPVPVIATCMYYHDLTVMQETAELLEHKEDSLYYALLMGKVYAEFNMQFFDDQTNRYANGSQAAQAMALVCGLVKPECKEKVLFQLVNDIEKRGWATSAGDVGHPYVLAALTINGRSDVVSKMTLDTEQPGYGYQVKCGATTLAEDWDGPNPDNPHGSQNHFMLGAIEEWFYSGLAGLCSLRTNLPYDKVLIRPHFAEQCNEVEAWTLHPYGKVKIHWKKGEKSVNIKLSIPANLNAIFMNEINGSEQQLGSGEHELVLILNQTS